MDLLDFLHLLLKNDKLSKQGTNSGICAANKSSFDPAMI